MSAHYLLHTDSGQRWHKLLARPLWLGNDAEVLTGFIGKCVDVHEERMNLDRLIWQASTDALTGLLHRKAAKSAVQNALDEAASRKNFVLMLFDLDFFKSANDRYGHLFGDDLLQETARRVLSAVRDAGITARIGGDEFLVFVEASDPAAAVDRIFSSLGNPYRGHPMTVSMGAARAPQNGTRFEDLFYCADQALYAAKQQGRNRYRFYDESMSAMLSVLSEIPGSDTEEAAAGQDRAR